MPRNITNKEKDLMKIAQKRGSDADLVLLDRFYELQKLLEEKEMEISRFYEKLEEVKKMMMYEVAVSRNQMLALKEVEVLKGDRGETGERGEKGERGEDGFTPIKGKDYFDGRDGKDGKDGQDGQSIVGVSGKDGVTAEELKKVLPSFGQEMRDGLELLQKEEDKLKIEAIGFLRKELDELRVLRTQRMGGGGTSAIGVAAAIPRILHKETPTGDIDGANTDYTTEHHINAVISLAINGQVITDDEFTVSGNTITMNDALPAALSGTSFRVVYI